MGVKRKDTKKRILESALKLFSEKGIRETTIKDIAKEKHGSKKEGHQKKNSGICA